MKKRCTKDKQYMYKLEMNKRLTRFEQDMNKQDKQEMTKR